MNFHSSTPTDEVLRWLRERSIAENMPRTFIDKLDELSTVEDKDEEIEKLGDELSQAEEDKENLLEALTELRVAFVDFLDNGDPDNKADRRIADTAVEIAQAAIARHSA